MSHTAAQIPPESSIRYPGWPVVLAASACVFVSFASLFVYTFGIFLKPIAAEFHWTREAVSAAFGFAALSIAFCSPPLGALFDRFPARRIIVPCFVVFGCAFASLSVLTDHLWHLYAIFALLGVVGNGTAHLAYSRVLATWFDRRRGAAFAVLLSGCALGAMIHPLLAQALITAAGWRNAFLILGLAVLAVGLPLGFRVRERPASSRSQRRSGTGFSVPQALQSHVFWMLIAVLFLCSIAQNGAIAHLSAMLTDRGITPEKAALAASTLGGASLLGRLVTGWLVDRHFAPRVACCILLFAAAGTLILANAHSAFSGVLAAACIGIGMGAEADFTPYLLSKYFGLRSFSTLYGLSWTAYAVAAAIGPIIMGKAFDMTGSYARLLTELACATLVASVLLLMLPRYPVTFIDAQAPGPELTPAIAD